MKNFVFIILIGIFAYACKKEKYEHEDAFLFYPCKCCELTDSIEGIYEGRYVERVAYSGPTGYTYDTIVDTIVSVQFQKVNLNQDLISDSLYCKFDVSGFVSGEVFFTEENLNFLDQLDFDPNFYQNNYFDIYNSGDLIFYNTTYINRYFSYTSKYFKGIKQ